MDYEIVRHTTEAEKIRDYSSFLSSSFVSSSGFFKEERTTPEYLTWQYRDNPCGQVLGYSAYYRGIIVGHFSTLPVNYLINGEKCKGLLALNLVTHPEHRGKGLFLLMCQRTFEDASDMGYRFIVGVANQNSTHGLVDRLGFNLVSPLDVRAGFGNMLIDKQQDYGLRSFWEPETLKWRLSNPSARYFINRERFVIAPTGKMNIYAQIYQANESESELIAARPLNNPLRVWIGLGRLQYDKSILLKVPESLKPVPLNFIFKNLSSGIVKFDRHDVLIELIDFDAY
jgi:GNAT superfamily N-acetyltransferase